MIFTLIVTSNHLQNNHHALSLARNLVSLQHSINCIYFLFDGAYSANRYIELPSDEPNLAQAWSRFAEEFNLRLSVCAASSYRRGVTEQLLAAGFSLGSIGQLVESCAAADRVIRL